MWIPERKKTGNGQQELQVIIKLKELFEGNRSAESFVSAFKNELTTIKRSNIFSAEYGYKAEIIDETTIEIWKMTVKGEKNYLMFVLKKGEDKPGPFDHL